MTITTHPKKNVLVFFYYLTLLLLAFFGAQTHAQQYFGTVYNYYTNHTDNQEDGETHDNHDNHDGHEHNLPPQERQVGTQADFDLWLTQHPWQGINVARYEYYLKAHLNGHYLPPMYQLLTTARSWQSCGAEPYQIPPNELWENILPTLKLYTQLRQLGILPPNTEIRSVYRNPDLNRCAGGAAASKHLTNGAIDIWVPTYDMHSWQMKNLQNRLCQFWIDHGAIHQFGLGIYATGAIHLDTQGYRKWGAEYSEPNSPCRYLPPTPSPQMS